MHRVGDTYGTHTLQDLGIAFFDLAFAEHRFSGFESSQLKGIVHLHVLCDDQIFRLPHANRISQFDMKLYH